MEENEHRRRPRYKGRYPRKFEEKYKEQNPDRYKEDVARIISKGKTPAGMHIPIMVKEILEFLSIEPGQTGMDATLGYGGHTEKMLEKLQGLGHLYATDVDTIEMKKTEERLRANGYGPDILTIVYSNFKDIDRIAGDQKFDFVLADLGVSSMQIDNPERGFSFKTDGPLDLRLDPSKGRTAAEQLRTLDYEELVNIFTENADEPYAEKIAREIQRTYHKGGEIETTAALHAAVERALLFLPEADRKEAVKKSSQRVFQALRIEVNGEFPALDEFLMKLPEKLKSGGRAAVLTFHSGEDRRVKKAFKAGEREGIYSFTTRDVIRPSQEECYINPRAHSTKLRCAVKA